jgi:hypothetical protein
MSGNLVYLWWFGIKWNNPEVRIQAFHQSRISANWNGKKKDRSGTHLEEKAVKNRIACLK